MTAPAMVVIDASVAVAVVAAEPRQQPARRLIADPAVRRMTPDLMALEAANAFWKRVRRGIWTRDQHDQAMNAVLKGRIEFAPTGPLIRRAAQLSLDHDHPVYDCVYVALAQRELAPIATLDARMAKLATAALVGLCNGR